LLPDPPDEAPRRQLDTDRQPTVGRGELAADVLLDIDQRRTVRDHLLELIGPADGMVGSDARLRTSMQRPVARVDVQARACADCMIVAVRVQLFAAADIGGGMSAAPLRVCT